MFILITVGILLVTALVLLILRFASPNFRFSWLVATGGALVAWVTVFIWQARMPIILELAPWRPESIFRQSPLFIADGIAWAFALSITTVCVAVIVTAVARENFPSPVSWIGTLLLTSLGLLAVTADNPLTLVLLWAAIDLGEMVSQMGFVENPKLSERNVIAFGSRLAGILILLWASMISASDSLVLDFLSAPPRAGLYLVIASAFRLGVFPLHLPYASESSFRRGLGTSLRVISAASSLILLSRIPLNSTESPFTPYLMVFVSLAALYGAWMWFRSPDELAGRPYWMIGMGAIAVAAALRGHPIGAAAWSCALILCGSVLFLASAQNRWLDKVLYIGAWGMSSLPFSLTASGWSNQLGRYWYAAPLLVMAHAALLAGFIRQGQRSSSRTSFEHQPIWAKNVYPFGIYLIPFMVLILGFFGWNGTMQLGNWLAGLFVSLLTLGLLWLTPRVRILNPVRAHWVRPVESSRLNPVYQTIWDLYRSIRRVISQFSNVLEGESGIMWTLFFLVLFISLFTGRTP